MNWRTWNTTEVGVELPTRYRLVGLRVNKNVMVRRGRTHNLTRYKLSAKQAARVEREDGRLTRKRRLRRWKHLRRRWFSGTLKLPPPFYLRERM